MSRYDVGLYDVALYDNPPGTVLVELYVNGVWTDITSYVRIADQIVISRGRSDWSTQSGPATCLMTLDNRDGRFSPRNTSGAYYPYLVRNTQIRVSVYLDDGSTTVRFWGDVVEWPVSWDPSGREVVTRIVAAGLRRQLGVGAIPFQSAYRRFAGRGLASLVAYWPLEDGAAATQFASYFANGPVMMPLLVDTVTPAADTAFVASLPVPDIAGDQAGLKGFVGGYTLSATGQQVRMFTQVSASVGGSGTDYVVYLASGDYIVAEYIPVANTLEVAYRSSDGTTLATSTAVSLAGSQPWTNPTRISIESVQNAGNIDFGVAWLNVNQTSGFSISATATTRTLTRVSSVMVRNGGSDVTSTVGHITVQNTKTSIFADLAVLSAYSGETCVDRAIRLANEQGVTYFSADGSGVGLTSQKMGPQGANTFLDLYDECAAVDGGLSTESVTGRVLTFRARGSLYDLSPTLTLDYSSSTAKITEIVAADDDQYLQNDITVVRTGGSSARQSLTTGNTGTTTAGDYAVEYDLSLFSDTQTTDQAGWRLAVGTADFPRWPTIVFDAVNNLNSTNRTALVALREGLVLQINNLPTYTGRTSSNQKTRVVGWTETIGVSTWIFDVNALPAEPFNQVFILDSSTYGVLDTNRLGF